MYLIFVFLEITKEYLVMLDYLKEEHEKKIRD